MWPRPLTDDLEIQCGSKGCRVTCVWKTSSTWVQRFMSYQQWTRFRTTLDFDREYLWHGSSNRQTENAVMNYDFSTFNENNWVNFGPLWNKWPWRLTLIFNRVRAVVKVHVDAKFHQAECSSSWVIMSTEKKTPRKTIQPLATAPTVITISVFENLPNM